MKIAKIKKNIYINSFICALLIAIFLLIFFYITNLVKLSENEVEKIKIESQKLRMKTVEVENNIKDAKKYKEIWNNIENNKKTTQIIKIDDVNRILIEVAKNNNVNNPKITMSVPINLDKGLFQRKTITTLYTSGNLSFLAFDDVSALNFIQELQSKLSGNFIVLNIELNKKSNYSQNDFVAISKGSNLGNVSVKIDFAWYNFRQKEQN